MDWLRRLARDEDGQDIVEYALLTAFFGLCALAAFASIQNALGVKYTGSSNGLQGLWDPPPPSGSQMPAVIDAPAIAVLTLGVVAAMVDVSTRKVPNALTFGAAAVGFVFGLATNGLAGLGWSLAGWAVGVLLFLPLFALRAMGGGDVKLLAAMGAWLGPALVVWVAVYGAIAGGVVAIPLLLARKRLRATVVNAWGLLAHWRTSGLEPHPVVTLDNPEAVRMPYALPIALGALATLWLRVW